MIRRPAVTPALARLAAERIIRLGCRRLPAGLRDERYREWTAELPAVLTDPGIRNAAVRSVRAVSFAAGAFRTARRLGRAAGDPGAGPATLAGGTGGGWASRSWRHPLSRPALPDGVALAITAVVLWLTIVVLIRVYPPAGAWNYAYIAAGIAAELLAATALVRFVLWLRRRSGRTRRP